MRVFLALGLVLTFAAGSYAQTCACTSGVAALISVCGNDGKDYSTVCDLVTAQKNNPNLGARCLGKCPCQSLINPYTGNPAFCPRPFHYPYEHGYGHNHGYGGGHNNGGRGNGGFGNGGFGGGRGNGGYGGGGRGGGGGRWKRALAPASSPTDRRFIGGGFGFGAGGSMAYAVFFEPRVCLTDGTDVYGLNAARCAINKARDGNLGIRCLGSCRQCRANPQCPVAQFPTATVAPPTDAPVAGDDITLPPVIGTVTQPPPTVAPPPVVVVTEPPPLPDFLLALKKIYE
ncbi:hypothetical protein BV898_05102 [Hypsibius exemplaris]|uniref:Kazal-like domain-containing protein n=1 Tax=Hypsibius exemplaris TaxID=2072580 RepID=A0A1W0X0L8_HYPEX|nr:hypothetical protein BV898_05102 [Hypsibius exemplaris]